jgi:hypothetical protein
MKFVYYPQYPHRSPEFMKTPEYRAARMQKDREVFDALPFLRKLRLWWRSPHFTGSVRIEK